MFEHIEPKQIDGQIVLQQRWVYLESTENCSSGFVAMVSHAQVPTQPGKENTSMKGKGSWKGTGKQTGLGISLAESLPGKKMDFSFCHWALLSSQHVRASPLISQPYFIEISVYWMLENVILVLFLQTFSELKWNEWLYSFPLLFSIAITRLLLPLLFMYLMTIRITWWSVCPFLRAGSSLQIWNTNSMRTRMCMSWHCHLVVRKLQDLIT